MDVIMHQSVVQHKPYSTQRHKTFQMLSVSHLCKWRDYKKGIRLVKRLRIRYIARIKIIGSLFDSTFLSLLLIK